MKTNRKTMFRRLALSIPATAIAVLLLGAGGCSSHNNRAPFFGKVQERDAPGLSRQDQARFWAQVRVTSSLAGSHYKLGRYYQQSGKHEEAVSEFNKALRLDPKLLKAYNGLGMSLTALDHCEQAEEAFRNGLAQGKTPAWLYNNFGCSRMLCGEPDKAATLLRYAAELDRRNHRITKNLQLAELRYELASAKGLRDSTQPAVAKAAPSPQNVLPYQFPRLRAESPPSPTQTFAASENTVPVLAAEKEKKTGNSIIHRRNLKAIESCGIEVSNGNGGNGMARRSADFFRGAGFSVNSITNADSFNYGSSTIFYRDGYRTVAEAVALTMPGEQRIEAVADFGRKDIQVRVLLGSDMASIDFPATAAYQFNNDQHGLAAYWPATTLR